MLPSLTVMGGGTWLACQMTSIVEVPIIPFSDLKGAHEWLNEPVLPRILSTYLL